MSLVGDNIMMMSVKLENKSVEHSPKSINDYFSGKDLNSISGTLVKKLDFNDDTRNKLNNSNSLNNSIISKSNDDDNKSEDSDSESSSSSKKEESSKINNTNTQKSKTKINNNKENDDSILDDKLQKAKRERQLSFSSGEQ